MESLPEKLISTLLLLYMRDESTIVDIVAWNSTVPLQIIWRKK